MNAEMSSPQTRLTLRQRILSIVEDSRFDHIITAVIVINAIGLGLETSPTIMERFGEILLMLCLLYTSPSPRDATLSRMPSSA